MSRSKMKRIQFHNMSSWTSFITVGLSLTCLILGLVIYGLESNVFYFVGSLLIFTYLGCFLFFPRYVGWNKKGMQLKFSFLGMKSIPFNTIQDIVVDKEVFLIILSDGEVLEYNTEDINEKDILKLRDLIVRHSNLNS